MFGILHLVAHWLVGAAGTAIDYERCVLDGRLGLLLQMRMKWPRWRRHWLCSRHEVDVMRLRLGSPDGIEARVEPVRGRAYPPPDTSLGCLSKLPPGAESSVHLLHLLPTRWRPPSLHRSAAPRSVPFSCGLDVAFPLAPDHRPPPRPPGLAPPSPGPAAQQRPPPGAAGPPFPFAVWTVSNGRECRCPGSRRDPAPSPTVLATRAVMGDL